MEISHTYRATIRWMGERNGKISLDGKLDLEISTPPEFGGPPSRVSPEDIFVASAVSSYMTTFLATADKVRASFVSFSCQAEGTLEKVEGVGLAFTSIVLKPKIRVADLSEERSVGKALEQAKRDCLVTNSMNCRIELEPDVDVV